MIAVTVVLLSGRFFFSGGASEPEGEHLSLENAIIIDGIRMESDQPLVDDDREDSSGQIIYNNAFDDSPEENAAIDGKGGKNAISRGERDTLIRGLQRKDRRWHLVQYRIRKSDNLWTVARKFGIRHDMIIDFNNIRDPDMLKVGRTIMVPTKNGLYHSVRRGDTLTAIARRYGVEIGKIREQNGIRGSVIIADARLFIPDATAPVISSGPKQATREQPRHVANLDKSSDRGRLSILWPIRGRITSGFGNRRDPFAGTRAFHCGIDISANTGTPVKAALDGKVIYEGWKSGYGKMVVLRHRGGYITVYAHNSSNTVKCGDSVGKGDLIAYSGNSGAVTGAHLHFELRKYLTPLNPLRFLRE